MDLAQATDALYRAFCLYPLKATIEGCPHCELEAAEGSLHARPLHQLTWEDFGVYPFRALTTFGDEADFKHFLPRLFELFAVEAADAPYFVSTLFSKLNYASWREWPTTERAAVREFVAAWRRLLESQSAESRWILEELDEAIEHSGFERE